jgi:hypothetical protein
MRTANVTRESLNSVYALKPNPVEISEFASRATPESLNLSVVCALPIVRYLSNLS